MKLTQTIQITRRSKVGFGYTSACEKDEKGNLKVCTTTEPIHTGTPKQVFEMIENDRTLKSFQSGTFYTSAWFVKVGKNWWKVAPVYLYGSDIGSLFEKDIYDRLPDHVNVECEYFFDL